MQTVTNNFFHDMDVVDAKPIYQHPYRSNLVKQQYLLENDFIEPSKSEQSSPYISCKTRWKFSNVYGLSQSKQLH